MPTQPILLIEDSDDDMEMVRRSLHKTNIVNDLVICRTGKDGLDYIHNIRDDGNLAPVLIILDMGLPDVPGIEVLRSIRIHPATWNCRLIILTGAGQYQEIVDARQLGNNAFIQKGDQLPMEMRQFFDAGIKLGMWWLLLSETPGTSEA